MATLKNITRDSKGRIPQIWTTELAIQESEKYKTKKEFRTFSNSAYQYLIRQGEINRTNLSGKRHRLSTWEIFCSLQKSKNWEEFRTLYSKEYTAFYKRKKTIPESAYSHLGLSKTGFRWDIQSIKKEALKYKYRSEFMRGSSGAYDAAQKNGIIQEVCAHMAHLQSDFDCIYVWKTSKKEKGLTLIKIGVTSERLGTTRIKFVEKKSGLNAEILIIGKCINAIGIEAELKKIGKPAGFSGFSGSGEFYYVTDSQFEQITEAIENEAAKQRMV